MTTVAWSNKENNVQSKLLEQNTINGEQLTDINTNKGILQKWSLMSNCLEEGRKNTLKSCKRKSKKKKKNEHRKNTIFNKMVSYDKTCQAAT